MACHYYKLALLLIWVVSSKAENDTSGADSWKTLYRIVNDCVAHDQVSICFKMKAVNFLDRLVKAPNTIPITEYVSITSDPKSTPAQDNKPESQEPDLATILPRSLEEKSEKLNDMILSKLFTLATTKKIQYNLPDLSEGRRKKQPNMMMMMMAGAGMMMKMGMSMIGMIAAKAFIISKIALALALIMLLKKSQGGGSSHPQVVYAEAGHGGGSSGGGGGGGYKRYIDAQTLAYGSQPQDF